MAMEPSLQAILQHSQIGAGAHPQQLIELIRALPVVEVRAGEQLFEAGEVASAAYLLTLGQVEVRGPEGTLLATEHPGALLGEQALMPGSRGRRSASIVALEDCRFLKIERDPFAELFAQRRAALEQMSAARTRNRLGRTAAPLRALLADSQERSWDDGTFVFREGAPADGVYLVLAGQAQVVTEQEGEPVHVATMYPGQLFGEIGVLRDAPRSAAVVAHNHLRAAFVSAERVRALDAADGSIEAFLRSLVRSRELPQLGLANQYTVIEDGEVCIQTSFSLNDGRELVAMRTPGGRYTLRQAGAEAVERVNIAAKTAVSLDAEGRIVGFEDRGDYEDVGGLQALAFDGSPLSRSQRQALKKAARAAARRAPGAVVCRCLHVERQTIEGCIAAGADSLEALQEATGCGTGCGGCIRRIMPMLRGDEPDVPVVRLGPPQPAAEPKRGRFTGWLRSALGGQTRS